LESPPAKGSATERTGQGEASFTPESRPYIAKWAGPQ
jgi:hypothetical protein